MTDKLAEPLLTVTTDSDEKVMKYTNKSKSQWMRLFIGNIPLLILVIITLASLAGLAYFEAIHLFMHISLITVVATVAIIGSAQGSYMVYTSVQLQEQIEEFRLENAKMKAQNEEYVNQNLEHARQNKKLQKQVDQLNNTVKHMEDVSDNLENELKGFTKLRSSMEKYSNQMGAEFKETMQQANELYNSMEVMTKENERTLLYKCAQDLEFMDHDMGFSKVEFERFCKRIPKQHQQAFKDMNLKFDELAKDGIIEYEKIQEMIEQLLKRIKFGAKSNITDQN